MRSPTFGRSMRNTAVSTLCALLLAACGASPESMIVSAKDYLAKHDRSAATIQLKNALQKNPSLAEARYLLGTVYFEQGDYAGAEKELSRALEFGFSPEQVVPLLAESLVATGQVQRVGSELGKYTLADPIARARLMTAQATALLIEGKREAGVQLLKEALTVSPGYPPARVGMARIRAIDRDLAGSLVDVEAVIKDAPQLPEAHALRADLLVSLGRQEEAIPAYEAVIAAKPTDVMAYQNLISLLIRTDRLAPAQTKVQEMKKALGNHPLALYLQAYLDVRKGKTTEAYEGIQQVLRVAPTYVPAMLLAATLQLQRQDYAQARDNLTKILEANPNLTLARRQMVAVHLGLREPARALEVLQPLLKEQADNVPVLNLAGQVYAMNGDFTRAEEFFRRASVAEPKNAQVRTRLAVSRLAAGESEQAFADLEAASSLDVNSTQADITLIMAHLRRNEVAKALAAVQTLEKKKPDDPVTHNMKGGVLLASKDPAGARKAFEKALALKSDFLPAVSNLARLDVGDKQLDVARKRYESFIAKNPKVSQAYLQYAEFLAMTGSSLKDVQAQLEKGLAEVPTALPVRMALVRLLVQAQDAKRALALAQEAAAAAPDDPQVLDLLGRSQVAANELQQALATYAKLSQRAPTALAPLVAMADLQLVTKDVSGAEQSLRKALTLQADSVEVQQRLIGLLLANQRAGAALAITKEMQKQRKDAAIGYILEGEVLMTTEKKADAVPPFQEAFKRDKTAQSAMRLHRAYLASGQTAEASRLAADWVKANPKDLGLRVYLAERNLAEEKFDLAAQQYRQLLELEPKNPMLLNNLAWTLGKLNDRNAIPVAQQAAALAPNSPIVLDTLGNLLFESGDKAKGLEYLKKAVTLGPSLPQLRLSLAKALAKNGDKDGARKEIEAGMRSALEKAPVRGELERLKATL